MNRKQFFIALILKIEIKYFVTRIKIIYNYKYHLRSEYYFLSNKLSNYYK